MIKGYSCPLTFGGNMQKAIITVVGKDKVGIIASVCNLLAKEDINIMDISQTITNDFFNMMMIVNIDNMKDEFSVVLEKLNELGKELALDIKMQHEDFFDAMHRI